MTQPVPDLEAYRVPTGELTQPEYCFRVPTSIAKAPRENPEVHSLKRILTGLLNTSGGIIYIKSTDASLDDSSLDKWRVGLWEQLETFLPSSVLQSCVHLARTETGFELWVKKSPKLITLVSHLHTRGFAHSKTQYDANSIVDVLEADTVPRQNPLEKLSFQHMTKANIEEDQYVEVKCWKNVNKPAEYKKRFDPRTRRALFSLANVKSGGDMLLGISEDKESKANHVVGQKVKEQDEESLRQIIKEVLCGEDSSSVWGTEGGLPEFEVSFIPIDNVEGLKIIRIRVEHCRGGAFEDVPESYIISEDGFVEKLSFQAWKDLLINSKLSELENEGSNSQSSKAISNEGSTTSYASMSSTQFQSSADTRKEQPNIDIQAHLQGRNYLSWTTDKSRWYENIIDSSIELEYNILSFLEEYSTFKLNSPATLTPGEETILARYDTEEGLSDALAHIRKLTGVNRKGFAVASPTWVSNFQNSVHLPSAAKHLLDILSVDNLCNFDLWTVIQDHATEIEESRSLHNILVTGRVMKRKLSCMPDVKYGSVLDFQIHCHVYKLAHGECFPREEDSACAAFHRADPSSLPALTERLACVILEKNTPIRDLLGRELQIRLTAHQMEKVLCTSMSRFNLICGPPGCGKTYMALHMASRYPAENTHYLCTTRPFQGFLQYQGMKFAILVKTEQEFLDYIDRPDLEHIKCLIIDDVQLLEYSTETWNKLFKRIYRLKDTHLCLFADCQYQNFKSTNSTQSVMSSMMTFCMNQGAIHLCQIKPVEPVIHRNHKKMVSFIKSCFDDASTDNDAPKIACSQQRDGDDVEIRFLNSTTVNSEVNGLVNFVKTVFGTTSSAQKKVKSRRIAVLVDTAQAEEDAENLRTIFTNLINGVEVHDATVFPVRGMTVDTLDDFVGLDRDICIVLTDERMDERGCDRSTNNPKYKAFVASRGITRVVIVVERGLDPDMATRLKMDKLSMAVSKQDAIENTGGIRDLCFLEAGGQPAVFHLTFGNELGFVTMQGEHASLPVPRSDVNILRCTASTTDHSLMVMVDCDDLDVGPWRWALYGKQQTGGFLALERHEVDGWPWSLSFAPDNSIIMIVKKGADFRFRNYLRGGTLRWDHGRRATRFRSPRRIRVDNRGQIYVADFIANCIYVFTAAGVPCRELPQTPDPDMLTTPHGVAVAPSGRWLLVSHFCPQSKLWVVSMLSTDGIHMKRLPVITSPDRIWSVDLYHERYLAVGTEKNLHAYDIHDVF